MRFSTIAILVSAIALAGCKTDVKDTPAFHQASDSEEPASGTTENIPVSERKTPAYVEQRVNDIYARVFEQYGKDIEESESLPPAEDLDSLYCSRDWNKWLNKINEYDSENNADGIGFFEADYWTMGQDYGNLSVSDVKTVSLNDKLAVAEINLHNFDNITRVSLDLVFEGDNWKIDNFTIIGDPRYDWKQSMKEYMRGK